MSGFLAAQPAALPATIPTFSTVITTVHCGNGHCRRSCDGSPGLNHLLDRWRLPTEIRENALSVRPIEVVAVALPVGMATQPKRVREVHRIAASEPIDIEPAGEPQGVFLGDLIPSRASV